MRTGCQPPPFLLAIDLSSSPERKVASRNAHAHSGRSPHASDAGCLVPADPGNRRRSAGATLRRLLGIRNTLWFTWLRRPPAPPDGGRSSSPAPLPRDAASARFLGRVARPDLGAAGTPPGATGSRGADPAARRAAAHFVRAALRLLSQIDPFCMPPQMAADMLDADQADIRLAGRLGRRPSAGSVTVRRPWGGRSCGGLTSRSSIVPWSCGPPNRSVSRSAVRAAGSGPYR